LLKLHEIRRIDIFLHIIFASDLFHFVFILSFLQAGVHFAGASFDEGRVPVNEVVDGKAYVYEAFHLVVAVPVNVLSNLCGVIGHFIHHFPVGF
jgi:hypothetical protein